MEGIKMMDKKWLRPLGQTDINVSALGLGTVKFGRNEGVKYPQGFEIPDMTDLAALLEQAKKLGVNVLDTAPSYGQSEERLGALLKGQRDQWVIAGKAGEDFDNGQSHYDFSADYFEASLERSLKRLNTDYIDIFLIHSDGRDMEIMADSALVERLYQFKAQGLVKALGASTKTVEGGILSCELFDCVMATYNADYDEERAVLDYAGKHGAGVLVKKALGSGHLVSGRQARNVADNMAHVFAHRAVSSVIAGTINPKHLSENVAAVKTAFYFE